MRLFTKDIDKQLFAQYPKGGDLENQKVVAKIFNPYGNGTWYLINSDPNDSDYLWAIVDLFEVEVGSVSRMDLETIKVPPFRLSLERDMSFTPINAQELFDGLLQGKHYALGGMMDANAQNKAMLLNQAEGFEHHAEEFERAVEKADEIPAWVVAKSQRASTDLSDITHYLDGENEQKREMEEGEEYARGGVTNEFGVESTEKMKELISEERNKKIKEWYGLGERVVVGRNDGYVYENSDGESESIVASNPSTKKVIEIIKNNPNVVEIGFNGSIKTGQRVGQELEIADDFYVVLWHKDDKYFKEGTIFEFVYDNGKYINKIVNKKDTITYKDRDDNRKYVYYTYLDKKYKTTSEARFARDYFKEMVDNNEIIIKNDSDYMAKGGYMASGGNLKSLNEYLNKLINSLQYSPSKKNREKILKEISEVRLKIKNASSDKMASDGYMADGGKVKNPKIKFESKVLSQDYKGNPTKTGFYANGILVGEVEKISEAFSTDSRMNYTNALRTAYRSKLNKDGFRELFGDDIYKNLDFNKYPLKIYLDDKLTFTKVKDIINNIYIGEKMANGGFMAKGGEIMRHKHYDYISIELIEPTNKGWKVKQIETHTSQGKKLSKPKEKISYFSKDEIRDLFEPTMAMGGETFDSKVKSIKSRLLENKKVSPSVQKDYGKTYSPKEAEESAKRIVGSLTAKERLKMRMAKNKKK